MVINSRTSPSTNLQISVQWIVVRKCLVVDNVVISGATEDTGGSGLKSPDSNESSSGQQSDPGGESHSQLLN